MAKYVFCALILIVFSCGNPSNNEDVDFASVKEINNPIMDVLPKSSMRNRDIVGHLFNEALEHDPKLSLLDKEFTKIADVVRDSVLEFNEYMRYNQMYYESVQSYVHSISDSTKRAALNAFFDQSKQDFDKKIFEHKSLERTLDDLQNDLKDQRVLMKLMVSEKLIRSYQDKKPSAEPIQSVNEQLRKLITESEKYTTIE